MRVFIILFCIFLNYTSNSQSYTNYTTYDGLPSNQVYDIIQNIDDIIWFATDNGVTAYDGYVFKNYNLNDGLTDLTIFSMQSTSKGRIYFQTLSGKLFYKDLYGDSIYPYKYNKIIIDNWDFISENFRFKNDTLYYGLTNKGLLQINPDGSHKLNILPEENIGVLKIADQNIPFNYINKDEIGKPKKRLHVYNISGYELSIELPKIDVTYQGVITKFITLESGIDLLYYNNYLYVFKEGRVIHYSRMDDILDITTFKNKIIFHINNDHGVRVYNSYQSIIKKNYQSLLNESTISDIFEDKQGGCWLATLNKGIYYFRTSTTFFNDTPQNLYINILSLSKKSSEEIYIGTENKGLFLYNVKSRKLVNLINANYGIYSMQTLDDQNLLCGTSSGTFIYNTTKNKFTKAYKDHFLPISNLNGIGLNPDGKTLMINAFFGFGMIDKQTHKMLKESWKYKSSDDGYNRVFSSVLDQNGEIWVGRADGLFHLKTEDLLKFNADKRLSARVESIIALPDSSIILGTKGQGILKIKECEIIEGFAQELSGLMVVKIKENCGDIWVSTNAGLYQIKPNGMHTKITAQQGLASNSVNDWIIIDSLIYTASFKGLTTLSFNDINGPSKDTPPYIMDIISLQTNKSGTKFKYNENDIIISYKSINFKQSGKIKYRYRINPKAKWNMTNERKVNLLNLPSATYSFELQALNEFGIWSKSVTSSFTILKPYYKKVDFLVACSVGLIFVFFALYKARIRRIRDQFNMQQHIKSLEVAALQSQMNPHFIFNCLNSIQKYILTNEKEKAANYLSMFSRLIRKVLDASKEGHITLLDEITLLTNYLELEQMRFKEKFKFKITISDHIDVKKVKIQPLLIQPIVENAVIHAMDKTDDPGLIEIDISKSNYKGIVIRIKDNGPGIHNNNEKDQFHKSVGLSNVRDRITYNQKIKNDNKSFTINTIFDDQGKAAGTVVELKI